MEQEFRTTFIPKKPVTEAPVTSSVRVPVGKPAGILFTLSVLILIISGILGGGVYVYHKTATDKTKNLLAQIQIIEQRLESESIQTFALLDKRIKNAETLLRQHAVMYPIYRSIEKTALPQVRYTKMDTSLNSESGMIIVNLSGEADSYRSIALQSQSLGSDQKFKNILFSNFVVTPLGQVTFDVSLSINKSDLLYPIYARQINSLMPTQNIQEMNVSEVINQNVMTTSGSAVDSELMDGLSF